MNNEDDLFEKKTDKISSNWNFENSTNDHTMTS